MSEAAAKPRRLKTWSYFQNKGLKRKPSEYEVVSVNLHNRTDNPEAPFELDPGIHMNRWYRKYCNDSPFKHSDWDDFRDPDELVYRIYARLQDGQEEYVDGLLAEFARVEHDQGLSPEWLGVLETLYAPSRYLTHTVQMASAYIVSIAPASTISNCAMFQDGDSLRWVHRTAYRTVELAKAYPDRGFAKTERATWEQNPVWQGFRELMERQLIAYDWGEAFVSLNLVAKIAVDEAYLRQFARAARRHGDTLLGMLLDAQMIDSERHRRWTKALVEFALEEKPNKDVINRWLEKWVPLGDKAMDAFCSTLPEAPEAADVAKRGAKAFRASMGFEL